MSRRTQPPRGTTRGVDRHSFAMAFQIAEDFFAVADPLLLQLNSAGMGAPTVKMPAVAVAAVNLGFSLELYLKSLRLLVGTPDLDTHHLWSLFKSLPVPVKESIKALYDAAASKIDPNAPCEIWLQISKTSTPAKFEGLPTLNKGLESLVQRCSNLFVAWRYTHESIEPGAAYSPPFSFEHCHLPLFRAALVQVIREIDKSRHPLAT